MFVGVLTVAEHKLSFLLNQYVVFSSMQIFYDKRYIVMWRGMHTQCNSLQWRHIQCQMTHVEMGQLGSGCCLDSHLLDHESVRRHQV